MSGNHTLKFIIHIGQYARIVGQRQLHANSITCFGTIQNVDEKEKKRKLAARFITENISLKTLVKRNKQIYKCSEGGSN